MKIQDLTAAKVNAAIDIYLAHAYQDEVLRKARAIRFSPDASMAEVLGRFEPETARLASYSLRLGSQLYPHMKLALWEAYFRGEYVFAVDRHDGFDFARPETELKAWLDVKAKNHQVKSAIEEAWYRARLPTLRQLKEDRLSRTDVLREFSGHDVLVVDNDADACAIVEMVLRAGGYGCIRAGSLAEAKRILGDPAALVRCGLALVDLLLADGTGRDVVAALRSRSETQDIPVIISSAMRPEEGGQAGVDGYLRKPYSAQDLLDAVGTALKRRYDGHQVLVEDLRAGRRPPAS